MGIVWKHLDSFGSELIKCSLVKRALLTCSDMMLTQLQASKYIEIGKWQVEKNLLFFPPGGIRLLFLFLALLKLFLETAVRQNLL